MAPPSSSDLGQHHDFNDPNRARNLSQIVSSSTKLDVRVLTCRQEQGNDQIPINRFQSERVTAWVPDGIIPPPTKLRTTCIILLKPCDGWEQSNNQKRRRLL